MSESLGARKVILLAKQGAQPAIGQISLNSILYMLHVYTRWLLQGKEINYSQEHQQRGLGLPQG